MGDDVIEAAYYNDDDLAPVMPAIDAVQLLIEEERRAEYQGKPGKNNAGPSKESSTSKDPSAGPSKLSASNKLTHNQREISSSPHYESRYQEQSATNIQPESAPASRITTVRGRSTTMSQHDTRFISSSSRIDTPDSNMTDEIDDEDCFLMRANPLTQFPTPSNERSRQDEYEFIPKSVVLDVYSNDPEVKRFLKQLPKIPHESGLNEQDYKCYSCRRPIGLVFGPPRLCYFDGHSYCLECHLDEKSVIPSRVLCNWDFNKYPVSKRNQHFLTLISNESMFELKKISPLLYKVCPDLREIEEMRRRAFFVRSYCTTCVHDSISFELTKLIWPREHLMKQTDTYSLEDLVQIKTGALRQVMKNVIAFGRQHVLTCVLCCQKGFICELCKSSQIIYPFDTDTVHRCNECQSTYHKSCFKANPSDDSCPRCLRLRARRQDV